MNTKLLAVALSMLAVGWLCGADRAADNPPIEELIARLGNPKIKERQQAARLLQRRGPVVLPELRKALKHQDAEIRRAAAALIPILERVAALEPKLVTVQMNGPLSSALKEIEEQTGYKLTAEEKDAERRASFAIRRVPFWEAVGSIEQQLGLRVQTSALESPEIPLTASGRRSPIVQFEGPFRLEATRFHEDRDIEFTQPGKDGDPLHEHHLILTVSILVEPRFVLLASGPALVDTAIDETGKSLRWQPADREKSFEERVGERFTAGIEDAARQRFQHTSKVFLQRSGEKARTVKEVRGVIPVKMMVKRNPVLISGNFLASKGKKFQIGGETLEVLSAEQDKDGWFSLEVSVPAPQDGVKMYWHDRVHVEDAAGKRFKPTGSGSASSGGRHSISLHFPEEKDAKAGPPQKLIVEDWIILDHLIPFTFKDVRLP